MSKYLIILAIGMTLVAKAYSQQCLKDKFDRAQVGDFIVAAQDDAFSLLLIHSLSEHTLILEEISVPSHQMDIKTINWHTWLSQKAPGSTAWTLYEIDLSQNLLVECFSVSKNGWVHINEKEQFFAKLLSLPLQSMSYEDRKKIGLQPSPGEPDRRAIWNPSLVFQGHKELKPTFHVFQARWPNDLSELALCNITLYFDAHRPLFPFPYWIEAQSSHYAFKIRTVDSGQGLLSPVIASMPHRPPQWLGVTEKTESEWKMKIRSPAYYHTFQLFAVDMTAEVRLMIPVPHQCHSISHTEEKILHIALTDLKLLLKPHHRYRWLLIPEKNAEAVIESEELFLWK